MNGSEKVNSLRAKSGGCVKKDIKEKNHSVRDRIKQLTNEDGQLRAKAEGIAQQIQAAQQQIANINTERLKKIGAIEELQKQVSK